MPRPVDEPNSVGGVLSYQLGLGESFTVLAVTFKLVTNGGGTPQVWLDYRDPTGGIIGLQLVHEQDSSTPVLYSLVPSSQPPTVTYDYSIQQWPDNTLFDPTIVTVPLMLAMPLAGRCTVNAYCASPPPGGATADPLDYLDAFGVLQDLHLWVEDHGPKSDLPAPLPPLLVHAADEA